MSGNRKDWRWCRRCRQWVLAFPLVDQWCDACWREWAEHDKRKAETREAENYLLRDYSSV